jgi:hypothetical protein
MTDIDYESAVKLYGSQNKAADALNIPRSTFKNQYKKFIKKINYKTSIPKIGKVTYKTPKLPMGLSIPEVSKKINTSPLKRVLFVTDSHDSPGLDKERFKWIGYRARHGNYDALIHGGDFADLQSLCSHVPNDTYAGRLKGSIQADIESLNEAVQTLYAESGSKWIQLLGNHEDRAWLFENNNPEVFGIVQHYLMNVFQSIGWETHLYGKTVNVHGVDFTHAVKQPNNNKRPIEGKTSAQQVANNSGRDTVFGHVHKYIVYPLERNNGANIQAICGGCSMPEGYIPSYIGHNRPAWSYGVTEVMILDGKVVGSGFIPMALLQGEYEAR